MTPLAIRLGNWSQVIFLPFLFPFSFISLDSNFRVFCSKLEIQIEVVLGDGCDEYCNYLELCCSVR